MVNEEMHILAEGLLTESGERLSKVFFLKDYSNFEKKYPLICIPSPLTSEL